jgi:hypothetical protein
MHVSSSPVTIRRRGALAIALTPLLAAIVPSARADDGGSWSLFGPRTTGSGKLQNDKRAVTGFQAVAIRGSLKLVLRQGTHEGVELRADDNILALIETQVVDRDGVATLEIGPKRGVRYSSPNPVTATVDLISLKALSIAGSGDIVGDALKTPVLRISVAGSGDIRLNHLEAGELNASVSGSGDLAFDGHARRLKVSISGSGDLKARALETDDVTISIAGSGDASVNAKKTLSVSIAGNGDVSYVGDAVVKSSIAGMGSVKKL